MSLFDDPTEDAGGGPTCTGGVSPLAAAMAHLELLVDRIERGGSPEERAIAALDAYGYQRSEVGPLIAAARRQAVRELRASGYSLRECADLLGVTDSRIAQITGS